MKRLLPIQAMHVRGRQHPESHSTRPSPDDSGTRNTEQRHAGTFAAGATRGSLRIHPALVLSATASELRSVRLKLQTGKHARGYGTPIASKLVAQRGPRGISAAEAIFVACNRRQRQAIRRLQYSLSTQRWGDVIAASRPSFVKQATQNNEVGTQLLPASSTPLTKPDWRSTNELVTPSSPSSEAQ